MNLYDGSSFSKPSSFHNAYKAQGEETIDVLRSYDSSAPSPSSNSTTWADSYLYSPWSALSEMKPEPTAQPNTKIQSEKEYGSEADLYGLVSNILEEQDKTQPYFSDGICSPMLKSLWPLSLNRLSDHQDLVPDVKQSKDLPILQKNFRGVESVPSTEIHNGEALFPELPGVEQDDRWPYLCHSDNPNSYTIDPRSGLKEYPLPKSYLSPASMSETPKDPFQNREQLVTSLNKCDFYPELEKHDLLNNKTKFSKNSGLGFQEWRSVCPLSLDLMNLNVRVNEAYAKLIQAKQSGHKPNDFMTEQSYAPAKAMNLLSDRSFMSEYDHKSDYGRKMLDEGSGALPSHLQRLPQRYDDQIAHAMKPNSILSAANADWPLWMNSQPHSNSTNFHQNQIKINSLVPASQKGSVFGCNCSSACSFHGPDSDFQSHHSENLAFPYSEYSYGRDQTKEECVREVVSGKSLEPFNGLHENVLGLCNYENTGKKIYQDKRMQYNTKQLNSECLAKIYQGMLCNTANCKNQRLGSVDNKLTNSRVTHPLTACSISASMIGSRPSNLTSLSSTNLQSCFCQKLGASNHSLMDNYAYKELGQTYHQISDLLQGDTSLQNMASMLNSQKSTKLRGRSAAQLHLCLEECYQQCKSLEQDRKKTCGLFPPMGGDKKFILHTIADGYAIEFSTRPPTKYLATMPPKDNNQARVFSESLQNLLDQKVIRHVPQEEEQRGFYSHIFAKRKPSEQRMGAKVEPPKRQMHSLQEGFGVDVGMCPVGARACLIPYNLNCSSTSFYYLFCLNVCALASSIREMTVATRKTRTALWCSLQMALAFHPVQAHDEG
ncbi:meiosis-specific coiled-coil domain-containing protein MEIOC [Aquarana catesbeiana]|uniref:meiosis-specific coiled-coil domain-containing protein MEIOC n=1 Tax=Aquarana catesbeiana TaxID=8400 RepID=UPI003CCA3B7B